MANGFKSGTYTGTTAAISFELGFVPDYIVVINITDGDERFEWFKGMTDGHAIKQVNVVDSGSTGAAGMSRITANGISQYAGTLGDKSAGFTIGTALSESAKSYRYAAFREVD